MKRKFISHVIVVLLSSLSLFFISSALKHDVVIVSPHERRVIFTMHIPKGHYLYKDLMRYRVDHPAITIESWQSLSAPIERYDQALKETKKVFEGDVVFEVMVRSQEPELFTDAYLHVTYYQSSGQEPQELVLPLAKAALSHADTIKNGTDQESQTFVASEHQTESQAKQGPIEQHRLQALSKKSKNWSARITELVRKQQSLTIRLLFIFLLGILLSLTPCIYPMIPVTIGILQAQGSASLVRNFFLALAYVAGLATTFAIFGLLASCVGPLCGQLLSNPIFIIFLVMILGYFALSMLGLYEIRLPRFLQTSRTMRGGSLIAAYICGAASGTFASPCVSPGLALLLGIVATLGNKLLGFLFLFVFGVGLGLPLLVVGTLSSSTGLLPKAGIWMIEIKRLFGLMMIGACFYYLSYAVPLWALLWLIVIALLILVVFYLYVAKSITRSMWATIDRGIAFLLLTAACVTLFYAGKETFLPQLVHEDALWHTSYTAALTQAQQEGKLLFVDFWAPYCSVCIAINKKVLTRPEVKAALASGVAIKIDTTSKDEETAQLQKHFEVVGVPVFLIVDPQTKQIVKRWGAELYGMPTDEFAAELQKVLSGKALAGD